MSSASTVDGLISGLSTSDIIAKLVQIEAAPQTVLKARQSTATSTATYYRNVNTRFDSLRSAAEALAKADGFTATKTASSSSSVAVSATASAAGGTLSFTVDSVATRHTIMSDTVWTATSDAFGQSSISLPNADGTAGSLTTGGSLADTVAAVNGGAYGVTASAVQVGTGQYRLQLTAKDPGLGKVFTASAGTESFSQIVDAGADTSLTVGTGPGKYTVTSPTTTVTGLLDGVTLTVGAVQTTPVTVSVSSDPAAVAAKVKAMVDAANDALKTISDYTDPKNDKALLKGDYTLRAMSNQILDAVSSALGGVYSASQVGVATTRTGTLTFDSAAFTTALAKDPALAQRLVAGTPGTAAVDAVSASNGPDGIAGTADDVVAVAAVAAVPGIDGLATRLAAIGKSASDPSTGTLTLMAQSKDASAKDYQTQIDDWDVRLVAKQDQLQKYYTALETSLGALKSQSTWLAGQLANLPTWSSGK